MVSAFGSLQKNDRITTLPDSVLCHILSFLPTKDSVATCVLSKPWKHLWRSVPTLHFECAYVNGTKSCFVDSVHAFVHSRHLHLSLLRFRFRFCCRSCYMTNVYTLVTTAAQNRLQELDLLYLSYKDEPDEPVPLHPQLHLSRVEPVPLPSAVLSCKTLVVLKLTSLPVEAFSSVDLPLLKILHLMMLRFPEHRFLAEFLSGCPNVEDLIVDDIYYTIRPEIEPEFKNLPKLITAVIDKRQIPLEVVYNVQFLRVNAMDEVGDYGVLLPEYPNLAHIELDHSRYAQDWPEVLRLLNHCPKVQSLVITQAGYVDIDGDKDYCECPRWVPKCLSLHLKTCCIDRYCGSERQFEFAKYILQNARVLEDMTICSHGDTTRQEKFRMIKRLSLCTRLSSTCVLSFS